MKYIKSIIAALLLFAVLLAVGCENAETPATETETDAFETETGPETETETETGEPEKEDTRLSPVFSVKGGVYDSVQSLALSLPENAPEGAYITYTEDCSEPGKKSTKYENEIEVLNADTSVIRAACFDKDGERLGYIKTATYIKAEKGRFSIPVVSLVTEKKNLYGKKGIADNPTKTGKDWERPCHVEIVMPDGQRVISQDAGLRIFGGSSRGLPQKSFRVIARRDGYYDEMKYNGNGSFDYPLFDGRKDNSGKLLERPLFEWSDEEQRLMATHHPFTLPNPDDIPLLDTAPEKVRAVAYDFVCNGVEVGGGSLRIHDGKLQEKMFEILGFTPERAMAQFGFLINAFKYGAPPHAGLAFGLDRFVSIMAGLDSIRDCIAFPKNNSGRDVMLDAPSELDVKQLEELQIRLDLNQENA